MTLRIGFVSAQAKGDWQARRLVRALRALGTVEVLDPARLRVEAGGGAGVCVRAGRGDARRFHAVLLGRLVGPGADADLQLDAGRALELAGVPTLNRVGPMLEAQDKLWCAARLAAAGLPTPWCTALATSARMTAILRAAGPAAVAKPVFGSLGEGIFRVHDATDRARLRANAAHEPYLVQRFVPPGGVDFRLFVVGDRVEACVRRTAPAGDFRSNDALGAHVAPAVARPAWRELAVEVARTLGLDFCGVDLALEDGRPTVLEVNGFPGFRAVHAATGRDMAEPIARRVAQAARVRKRRLAA